MPEFPDSRLPNLPFTTPYSEECLGNVIPGLYQTGLSSTGWPSANLAMFYPWRIECPITIVKGAVFNGATTVGNIDVGVYDSQFNRLVSMGSTAQSGTNVIQEFDITDTVLLPGYYYMAIAMSSTGGALRGISSSDEYVLSLVPVLSMATAFPLPSTATPARASTSSVGVWAFGFSTETTI